MDESENRRLGSENKQENPRNKWKMELFRMDFHFTRTSSDRKISPYGTVPVGKFRYEDKFRLEFSGTRKCSAGNSIPHTRKMEHFRREINGTWNSSRGNSIYMLWYMEHSHEKNGNKKMESIKWISGKKMEQKLGIKKILLSEDSIVTISDIFL